MIAFEIEIDGKKYVTASVEDWSLLAFNLTASRAGQNLPNKDGYIECSVGGLTTPDEQKISHHFR